MLRRARLLLLVPLLTLACSDSTAPSTQAVGTWRLQTVNALALPFTLEESGAFKFELTGEVMTLDAQGRVDIVTNFRVTDGGTVTTESIPDEGTYVVNGSSVVITWPSDGTTETATVSGRTMTSEDFVYRRD
jgi:hypothetical protein